MAGCGFAPDAIDAMPMQDVLALTRYWHDHPPTNETLAVAYGIKPGSKMDPNDPSGIGTLVARWPDGKVPQ